jgi:hypothetical protein
MASNQEITEFKARLDLVLAFDKDRLISRPEWGEISLVEARPDFDRIFTVARHLQVLPIEQLPDNVIRQGQAALRGIADLFVRIDKFRIATDPSPQQTRQNYLSQIQSQAEYLFTNTAQWIPFLAYQKGDVARNIEALRTALKDAEQFAADSRQKIEQRAKEIDEIITKAREASAAAGAAVFTQDFQRAADEMNATAGKWLRGTAVTAVLTLLTALGMWHWTEPGLDQSQLFQKLSTKLVVLAVLFTATVWCGKNYRALKHLATINRHRALSIQTLQAFSAAASDVHTKDAVLLEASRAVFGNVPTGYVEGGSGDSDVKVVELARNFLPTSDKP